VTPIGFLPRSCVRLVPESTRQEIGRRLFVSPRNERNVSIIALRDCRGSERIVTERAAHQRERIAQGDAADEEDRRAPRGRRISSETRSKSRIRRAANSSKRVNRAGQSRRRRHPLNFRSSKRGSSTLRRRHQTSRLSKCRPARSIIPISA